MNKEHEKRLKNIKKVSINSFLRYSQFQTMSYFVLYVLNMKRKNREIDE